MWMFETLVYGVLKGSREIVKKRLLKDLSVVEALFFYTLFSFVMVCPDAGRAGGVPAATMLLIMLKAFFVFLAWILSFYAIKNLPISLYGVLDLSRVLFATGLAVAILGERPGAMNLAGLFFVCLGLLLLKAGKGRSAEKAAPLMVAFAFGSCMLNAASGLMDKILMRSLTSSQLQFWYMLFMTLYYLAYVIITRTPMRVKKAVSNVWLWLLAVLFVAGDRALFIANASPDSLISIMTLIKQSGAIVVILAGRFIFHEKDTGRRLLCAGIIIAGIVLSVL